jgi:fermentation-respiration switch protein FrsA (DUF1100 family)
MRFDFRGCGESEGERGWILCLDQVADTSSALSYMARRPYVAADRIALIGSSFGAAVAIYTGGVDKRVKLGFAIKNDDDLVEVAVDGGQSGPTLGRRLLGRLRRRAARLASPGVRPD